MNCSISDDLLIRKTIDSLSEDETAALEHHLDTCAACRKRAATDATLFAAMESLRDDLRTAEPTFVFSPNAPSVVLPSKRSVVMPLVRAGLAMAAVWALVTLVWQRAPTPSPPSRIVQHAERLPEAPVVRTASLVPWLGARPTALRGQVRLAVPIHVFRPTFSAMKTPSILIRPRRKDNVDRDQDFRNFRGDHPVGARPRTRGDARV